MHLPEQNTNAGQAHPFWNFQPSSRPAIRHSDGRIVSYAELAEDVAAFAARLSAGRGVIGIQCDGDYRQYVAYLGALRAGCPAVLLGPGHDLASVGLTLAYHYSPATDQLDRLTEPGPPHWDPELAVLLSTSGSTGSAKWVRLSFSNLTANAAAIAEYLALSNQDRAPLVLPFQYSYGMSVVNSHLLAGGELVLTDSSVIDADFWTLFAKAGCTSLAGVPHTFDLLEQAHIPTAALPSLRYMTQAGGRMPPEQVARWASRSRQEGWDFFVMYGQTEAGPRMAYLPPVQAADNPASIGIAIPGGEIRITDDQGLPLPDGEDGELTYRGPNVMLGYAQCDADLARPRETDVLHTGDLARRQPDGTFVIVGRKSRFAKLFGLRIGLDEVEAFLRERHIAAVCAVVDDRLHIAVSPELAPLPTMAAITAQLGDWLKVPPQSFPLFEVDAIPRLPNGKVDQQAIRQIAQDATAARESLAHASPPGGWLGRIRQRIAPDRPSVLAIFAAHFPDAGITAESSFNAIGGDSLSYVSVAMELEELLGQLPDNWPELPIAELQARPTGRHFLTTIDSPTLIRSVAIGVTVAGHFGVLPRSFHYNGGGAFSMFLVAGMTFASFTLPQVLATRRAAPVLVLAFRIAILTLAYFSLLVAATGRGDWRGLAFIGNFISPDLPTSAWFVSVYVQLLLLVAAACAVPCIRRMAERWPFAFACGATLAFEIIAATSDALIDLNYLYRRLPHLIAWMFLLGVATAAARSRLQRIIVTGLLGFGLWQFNGFQAQFGPYFLLGSALVLIWTRSVILPAMLVKALRLIAAASLIIYLTQFNVFNAMNKHFGQHPTLAWLITLTLGTVLWRIYDPIDAWIARYLRRIFGLGQPSASSLATTA